MLPSTIHSLDVYLRFLEQWINARAVEFRARFLLFEGLSTRLSSLVDSELTFEATSNGFESQCEYEH